MTHLKVKQQLGFGDMLIDHAALHALDDLERVIDWASLEALCEGIYAGKAGRPSYPLSVLLRSLLLGAWYGLSDVKLEAQLVRDLLFRKFVGLTFTDTAPDHSTLSRFRTQLSAKNLADKLLTEVNRQLSAQNIIMKTGSVSIIDATVIEAHQSRPKRGKDGENTQDKEANYAVKAGGDGKMTAVYGYKLHLNVEEDGFIQKQSVTAGNVHDSQERDRLLTGEETALYADSAYASHETSAELAKRGVKNAVMRRAYRNHPLNEQDKAHNALISVTRSGVEAVFGAHKLHRNLRKTRFMGLCKNIIHFGLVNLMHNLQKGAKFLQLYGKNQSIAI
jgi:transposase, IS5 family